uniref:Talpid3-like protein n=1 Tax=Nematostella vectensis TaxID=45351 RepID=B7U3W9_NEMVE|nr:talpid3-like protein [Nematostella vectensis]
MKDKNRERYDDYFKVPKVERHARGDGKEANIVYHELNPDNNKHETTRPREILSITNAAVEGLNTARISSGSDSTSAKEGWPESTSVQDEADQHQLSTSSKDELQSSSTTTMSGSFSGVQRVRVPSRLLKEIPSPLDTHHDYTGDSTQGDFTPIVVQHFDDPSAKTFPSSNHHPGLAVPPMGYSLRPPSTEAVSTTTMQSHLITEARDGEIGCQTVSQRQQEPALSHNQTQPTKKQFQFEEPNLGKRMSKQQADNRILQQGDPNTRNTASIQTEPDKVKAKSFLLNEKERSLKEQFMQRQDKKSAPVRRVVMPTVIPTQGTQQSGPKPDDPVSTAAAIAAAAASAATVPFLQIQHGLESQIGALVSTLQGLQSGGSHHRQEQDLQKSQQIQTTAMQDKFTEPVIPASQGNSGTMQHGVAPPVSACPSHQPSHATMSDARLNTSTHLVPTPHHSSDRPHHATSYNAPSGMPTHREPPPHPSFASHQPYHVTSCDALSGMQTHREPPPHPSFASHQPYHVTSCDALSGMPTHREPPPHPSFASHQPYHVASCDALSGMPTHRVPPPHPLSAPYRLHHGTSCDAPPDMPRHGVPPPHPSSVPHQPVVKQAWVQPEQQVVYKAASDQAKEHRPVDRPTKGQRDKTMAVKSTKTQTSPQEYRESPLHTPLPRKRLPVPISSTHIAPPTERVALGHHDKRVHFDDDVHWRARDDERKTRKARDIIEELLGKRRKVPDTWHAPLGMNERRTVLDTRHDTNGTRWDTNHTRLDANDSRQDMLRRWPSVTPQQATVRPTAETQAMLDYLTRISKDLKTVMHEADKLKTDLKTMRYEEDVASSHCTSRPSPLDAYLLTERSATKEPLDPITYESRPKVQHLADAEHILRDVQTRRKHLESNLAAVLRQRDEEMLYHIVDDMHNSEHSVAEIIRIRKDVDKKIKELTATVQREVLMDNQRSENKQAAEDRKISKPQQRPGRGALHVKAVSKKPPVLANKPPPKKMPGKENKPRSKPKLNKVTASSKSSQSTQPVSSTLSTTAKDTYLTSVYGRQPYHPHRTTSKAPYLYYQSPIPDKTAALTKALLGVRGEVIEPTVQEMPKQERIKELPVNKDKFYFHPSVNASIHGVPTASKAPVVGHLVPMAVPLGKPNRDPSLRLPLTSFTAERNTSIAMDSTISEAPPASTPKPPVSMPASSNVAVITVKEEGAGEQCHKHRKGTKKTKKSALGVQVLPKVDIDSLTESSVSSATTPRQAEVKLDPPITRPDESEYMEMQNFIAVRDTAPTEELSDDDDINRIPTPDNPWTIKGHWEPPRLYQGPVFPPEQPSLTVPVVSGVMDSDHRVSEAIEDRAAEWIEQELLARIVSEMNKPLPDPTTVTKPSDLTPDSSVVSESEDGEVLAATIGLDGLQLFVNAGLPVDRDLVAHLIKDVITDQIIATLGYPAPSATVGTPKTEEVEEMASNNSFPKGTPVTTPIPTPVYTPPESEISESPDALVTPALTPSQSSMSQEMDSMETEPTPPPKEMPPQPAEESRTSEVHSPVGTPLMTPSTGTQTPPGSRSTPEPSLEEPEVSAMGTPVSTPQATVQTPPPPPEPSKVSSPTPSPEPSVQTPPPLQSEPSTSSKPKASPSPSSITTSTSTFEATSTTTATDEDMSEGQLIQPYVHANQFSEGEFAVAPGLLSKVEEEWDAAMLGPDEDSRNELIRVALRGLLQRGKRKGR